MGDAKRGQWFNACSQGGKTTYSYGDTFEEGTCAENATSLAPGQDPATAVSTTREDTTCRGTDAPYDQIANLSGNIAEWQDSCEVAGKWRQCRVQSFGVYDAPQSDREACSEYGTTLADSVGIDVGFRCCLD
jgi:hypothetical protein